MLWGVSGHLVLFMLVYAAVGTFVTTAMFGRVLSSLYYRCRVLRGWGSGMGATGASYTRTVTGRYPAIP